MNGFSDLVIEVFGEKGRHARTSVGVYTLPQNMVIEAEMIVEME
jgi:enamine deaminase RidA (YjgF/YER057c/UK114 family)